MCAVCLHFWCHSTGHATSPTLQAITKVFNDVTCPPPRAASRWPYVSKWTPLNFSKRKKKKSEEEEDEMFQTAAKTGKKRPNKQKYVGLWKWCWSGNSSHHQGFKGDEVNMIYLCSNFLTDLQRTWHFRKNYEHTVWKWPPPISHYSKSQIFVQKFNFDKTFSRVFHTNSFWQFFSSNQMCQQLKNP